MPGISWLLNNLRSSEGVRAHLENQEMCFLGHLNQNFVRICGSVFAFIEKYTNTKALIAKILQVNLLKNVFGVCIYYLNVFLQRAEFLELRENLDSARPFPCWSKNVLLSLAEVRTCSCESHLMKSVPSSHRMQANKKASGVKINTRESE